MATEVLHNEPEEQYEIRVDGQLAGLVTYQGRRGIIALMHTETLPEFKGQGLAKQLIADVLDRVRVDGLKVLPFCPFVRTYIAEHPEYLELVPGDLRENFELPQESSQ